MQPNGLFCGPTIHPLLLIYRPLRDGWLSLPCWLTDSGRLNHKVVTRPASSLAQDRESSPAEISVQPLCYAANSTWVVLDRELWVLVLVLWLLNTSLMSRGTSVICSRTRQRSRRQQMSVYDRRLLKRLHSDSAATTADCCRGVAGNSFNESCDHSRLPVPCVHLHRSTRTRLLVLLLYSLSRRLLPGVLGLTGRRRVPATGSGSRLGGSQQRGPGSAVTHTGALLLVRRPQSRLREPA